MLKRGQITIFIIVAIAIVGAITAVIIFRENLFQPGGALPPETREIKSIISECVFANLVEGSVLVGIQGGYAIPPENALETNFSYIAYGYYQGKNALATKEIIEKQISLYTETSLVFCIDSSEFPNVEIEFKDIVATTKIDQKKVSTSVRFPFTLTKENASSRIDDAYYAEHKINLGEFHTIAQEIVKKELVAPTIVDISYLTNLSYDVSLLHQGNDIIVYSISNFIINETENEYTFRFANKIR